MNEDVDDELSDAEVAHALIAIVSSVERGGCPVGACSVRNKDSGGMTIIMHYSNARARKAIRALESQRP